MSLYVLNPKTENKNITQDHMIETGKNVKAVYKLKKKTKKTIKIKILSVSFQRNF